jgi:hypothetical protein
MPMAVITAAPSGPKLCPGGRPHRSITLLGVLQLATRDVHADHAASNMRVPP